MQSPVDYWHFSVPAVFEVNRPATATSPSTARLSRRQHPLFGRSFDRPRRPPCRGSNLGANCVALGKLWEHYRRRRSKSIRRRPAEHLGVGTAARSQVRLSLLVVPVSPSQQSYRQLAELTASCVQQHVGQLFVQGGPYSDHQCFRTYPVWDESSDIANCSACVMTSLGVSRCLRASSTRTIGRPQAEPPPRRWQRRYLVRLTHPSAVQFLVIRTFAMFSYLYLIAATFSRCGSTVFSGLPASSI